MKRYISACYPSISEAMSFSEPAPVVSTALHLADDQAEFQPDEAQPEHELAVVERISLDRHPVAVYLARLAPSSRRTMRAALDAIAGLLTDNHCDALSLDWSQLRYRHTTTVRALLADGRYAPSTANRHLAALRGCPQGVLASRLRLRRKPSALGRSRARSRLTTAARPSPAAGRDPVVVRRLRGG